MDAARHFSGATCIQAHQHAFQVRVEGQCIDLDLDQLIIEFFCLVGDSADPGFQLDDVDGL